MEAALRSVLKDSLGEYVKAQSLEKSDLTSFPLVLRDLQLNEKKVQEEFDELHESAIQLTCGKIGSIKITPSWMGTIEVLATNIELTLSFSPTQALKNQMKPKQADDGYEYEAVQQSPPPMCPPRFCHAHDTSDKRVKCDPVYKECKKCGVTLQSSYKDFQFCPPCSEKEHKCMICGSHAPKASTYEPAAVHVKPPPPNCPPRFCTAHDSSDKRVKGDPCFKECRMCGIKLQSSYKDFQMCPPCSEKEHKCMICGAHAPNSSSGNPTAPQQGPTSERGHAMNSGYGKHPAPPPPPAMQQPWDNAPNRLPRGDATAPADNSGSMYMGQSCHTTRPPVNHPHSDRYGAPNSPQAFNTQLPPGMVPGQQQQFGAPYQQSRGSLPSRQNNQGQQPQNNGEEGFSGLMRLLASDLWNTCHHDNRQRFDSPDRALQPQFQGMRRGGA